MKLTQENTFISITHPSFRELLLSRVVNCNVELSFFSSPEFIAGERKKVVQEMKELFKRCPVKRNIHGPFMELMYESKDEDVRCLVEKKMKRSIRNAYSVGAEHMVVHSTYNPLFAQASRGYQKSWFSLSAKFWQNMMPFAKRHNCRIVIENIFVEGLD